MTAQTVKILVNSYTKCHPTALVSALCTADSLTSPEDALSLVTWAQSRGRAAAERGDEWTANPHAATTLRGLGALHIGNATGVLAAAWWAGWCTVRIPQDMPDPYHYRQIDLGEQGEALAPPS